MGEFVTKYWIQVGFGLIISFITVTSKNIVSKVKVEQDKHNCLHEGVLALLHDRLYQACQYYIYQGFITVPDLDNLEYLYSSYYGLGGNGTGTELYNRCKVLPLQQGGRSEKVSII